MLGFLSALVLGCLTKIAQAALGHEVKLSQDGFELTTHQRRTPVLYTSLYTSYMYKLLGKTVNNLYLRSKLT